jgi:hypothetical protein
VWIWRQKVCWKYTPYFLFFNTPLRRKKIVGIESKSEAPWVDRVYNKRTCREVSPGLDAPRVAGSFPNSPCEARWVRETSSHPSWVQSRTHRTCKYVCFLSHTPSHTHICSSSRYIRRCFVNIFQAKKITGLLILLYLRLYYLYCIFSLVFLQS